MSSPSWRATGSASPRRPKSVSAGFGAADDREGETLAETVTRRKERSQQRIDDMAESRQDEEAWRSVKVLGSSFLIDYESDSLGEDILAATDGAGVETVLDHRLEEYLDLDLSVVTEDGTIISTMGHVPETNGRPFYNKEVTIQPLKMDNHPTRQPVLERLARLMRQGVLTPIVADTYAFEDTAQAHQEVLAGGHAGKLVVTP